MVVMVEEYLRSEEEWFDFDNIVVEPVNNIEYHPDNLEQLYREKLVEDSIDLDFDLIAV